jgi:hypothetical protein
VPTIYTYASQQKLGKKIGNRKVFTQADVQKLLKGSKKSPAKRRVKAPAKRSVSRKNTSELQLSKTSATKLMVASPTPSAVGVSSPKPSFWTRLLGGRKRQQKVSLMEAKRPTDRKV